MMPEIRLDILTADPLLRLLVAAEGHEAPPFVPSWRAFKRFMALPTLIRDGGATFQVFESEGDLSQLEVFFGRELGQLHVSVDDWEEVRVVGVHFVFDVEHALEPHDLWSRDEASVDEFFELVEGSDAYRLASEGQLIASAFYSQEADW